VDARRLEVMEHLEPSVQEVLPEYLKSEEEYWQPSDMLPDLNSEEGFEQVRELQATARALPDDVLVVLIGDMITEEALPTYTSWIASLDGVDHGGAPRNVWGDWLRRWAGEENRHGDALNRYLFLSGRVNMREVECTVQNLISDGGDVQTGSDPYKAFVYTSFQEIATNISHRNVGRLASRAGEAALARLCSFIASDEARHARAYKHFFAKVLEVDPNEAMLAFQEMMKTKIVMPAMYMRERGMEMGETFDRFAKVAERINVYTQENYIEILESLIKSWKIESVPNLSGAAAKAQDYLCNLPERYRKIMERMQARHGQVIDDTPYSFSWLQMPEPSPTA
jgi:acyl-[acyl-carrier-protein] desaturase